MNKTHAARGFTLVELMTGMAATALVTAAMAGFAAGVADGWRATDASRVARVATESAGARLRTLAQPAKYIANCSGSTADPTRVAWVVLWRDDDFSGIVAGKTISARDGIAQMGELSLLEFRPDTASLWLYESLPYARLSSTARTQAAQPVPRETLEGPNIYDLFIFKRDRNLLQFLAPPRALVGPGVVRPGDAGQARLTAAAFLPPADATAAHQMLDYRLVLTRGAEVNVVVGTTATFQSKVPAADADIPK